MNKAKEFINSHNLINRIYDMVLYFGIIKSENREFYIKKFFSQRLEQVEYVETLAKYFENRIKTSQQNIELKYNLKELVYDLNYLKQYLR